MQNIYFRLRSTVAVPAQLGIGQQEIDFGTLGPQAATFVIIREDRNLNDIGIHQCTLEVSFSKQCENEKIYRWFETFLTGRVLHFKNMPFKLPLAAYTDCDIDEHGIIREGFGYPFEWMPPKLQEFLDNAHQKCLAETDRFLNLLLWMNATPISGGGRTGTAALYWNSKPTFLRSVPRRGTETKLKEMPSIDCSTLDRDAFSTQMSMGVTEPLSHSLLRQARSLAPTSQASSFLTLASALEAAVKTHIGRLAPDTHWLLQNIQSPPVFKLLFDYIPTLSIYTSEASRKDTWSRLKSHKTAIKDLYEARNKLAHSGQMIVGSELLEVYINLVHDLLFVLYFFEGHEWARQHISVSMLRSLDWPLPTRSKVFVTHMTGLKSMALFSNARAIAKSDGEIEETNSEQ